MNITKRADPAGILSISLPSPLNEHHVYIEWYLDNRAGGPPGYLANLLCGLNQIQNYDKPLILFDSYKGQKPCTEIAKINPFIKAVKTIVLLLPNGKDFYAEHFSKTQKRLYNEMMSFLSDPDEIMPDFNMVKAIDWSKTKTIHVHTVIDVVKIKNYLRRNYLDDVKVILSCHTPEPYSQEQLALSIDGGQSRKKAQKLADRWRQVELRGYREADIMIFPSEEAMEPLLNALPEFGDLISQKDIRYMATGCIPLRPQLSVVEAKRKYEVEGKTVIGYIGRHNSIKGYDLLKAAAQICLSERDDIVFLIGGEKGKAFQPLSHPRWIEMGRVNPAEMLQAVDVFVLPNRQTYFDLILLEVMSMGLPVIATETGGNKSVKKIADELMLCEPDSMSLARKIREFLDYPESERKKIGHSLLLKYQEHYTEQLFAQRYVDIIRGIYDDYNLWTESDVKNK